jgi:hypothetical protein
MKENAMRFIAGLPRNALLAAAAILLGACATGPDIRHDINPAADFAGYKTFGFFSPLATDRSGYQSVLTTRLKEATRRALESKGFVFSESNPDLLINFFANVQEKQELRSMPGPGYYGYRAGFYGGWGMSGVQTISYREGTLTVDVVEARRRMLVWQATAEGTVSDAARNNPGPAIDAVVPQMMAPLPVAGGS